jgi:DNA-binding YbaB/EbfC family protein
MLDKIGLEELQNIVSTLQKQAKVLETENSSKTFIAQSGGGMVKVTSNGNGEIIDIQIDDSLLDDKDSLQILLIAGINDSLKLMKESNKDNAMNMINKMDFLRNG